MLGAGALGGPRGMVRGGRREEDTGWGTRVSFNSGFLGVYAWGWCTGTTQRDGTGREEGGGFRMGNTCIPVRIYVDIWQYQYNIVKLNKIFKKYKKKDK